MSDGFDNIQARIDLDGTGAKRGAQEAADATEKLARVLDRLDNRVTTAEKAVTRFGATTSNAGTNVTRFNHTMRTAVGTFLGFSAANVAANAVRRFADEISRSIDEASGLEQAIGATETVFGNFESRVRSVGAVSAEQFGLSERSFLELANRLGNGFKNAGFTIEESIQSVMQIMNQGRDLASAFGRDAEDMVGVYEALNSAITRREFNPLERFGVALRAEDINLQAVQEGLAKTSRAVSEQAFMVTALKEITSQAAGVQGQWNREIDTAAQRMAVANARMENARATIGEALLPGYIAAAGVLGDRVAPAIEKFAGENGERLEQFGEQVGDVLGDLADAVIEAAPQILALLEDLAPVVEDATEAAGLLAPALGVVADVFTALPTPIQSAVLAFVLFDKQIMKTIGLLTGGKLAAGLANLAVPSGTVAGAFNRAAPAAARLGAVPAVGALAAGGAIGWAFANKDTEDAKRKARAEINELGDLFDQETAEGLGRYRTRLMEELGRTLGDPASKRSFVNAVRMMLPGDEVDNAVARAEALGTEFDRVLNDSVRARAENRNRLVKDLGLLESEVQRIVTDLNKRSGTDLLIGDYDTVAAKVKDAAAAEGIWVDEAKELLETQRRVAAATDEVHRILGLSTEEMEELREAAQEFGAEIEASVLGFETVWDRFDPDLDTKGLEDAEAAAERVADEYERVTDAADRLRSAQADLADIDYDLSVAAVITRDDLKRRADQVQRILDAERDLTKAKQQATVAEREAAKARAAVVSDEDQIRNLRERQVQEANRFVALIEEAVGSGLNPEFILDAMKQGPAANETLATILGSPDLVAFINTTHDRLGDIAVRAGELGESLHAALGMGVAGADRLGEALGFSRAILEDDLVRAAQIAGGSIDGLNGKAAGLAAALQESVTAMELLAVQNVPQPGPARGTGFWGALAAGGWPQIVKMIAGQGFNQGGRVPGVGNGDTVPAWLTPGEYVIRKQTVNALGVGFLDDLNRGRYRIPRYATGGYVAARTPTPMPVGVGASTDARSWSEHNEMKVTVAGPDLDQVRADALRRARFRKGSFG